jgi:hypothetical protein
MNSGAPGYVDEVSEQFYAQLQCWTGPIKAAEISEDAMLTVSAPMNSAS